MSAEKPLTPEPLRQGNVTVGDLMALLSRTNPSLTVLVELPDDGDFLEVDAECSGTDESGGSFFIALKGPSDVEE